MSNDHSVALDTKNQVPSRLDHALALAELGFHVFPVLPHPLGKHKGKEPAVKFTKWATRDCARIAKWWNDTSIATYDARGQFRRSDCNIGIYCGRWGDGGESLVTLDVDDKNGKRGSDELKKRVSAGDDVPPTRQHGTPTGGRHLIFRSSRPVANSVDKIAPGLDVRGEGGFVVAPGSDIDGKPYTVINDTPPELAPQWLIDAAGAPIERKARDADHEYSNTPASIARAAEWLEKHAPVSIKGQGGDRTAFSVAAHLKDLDLDPDVSLDLMFKHWRGGCGWAPDRLMEKIHNAHYYGKNEPGSALPSADFPVVEQLPTEAKAETHATAQATKPKLFFELFADIKPDLARPELVENLLDHGAMTVMYGESNSGKSFLAMDIAFAIAAGRPWHGWDVMQGMAAYIAAEGGGPIRKRTEALRIHHKLEAGAVPLVLIPCPVNLSGAGADPDIGVKPLVALIRAAEVATGQPCAFLVVDTLSRAMAGANENAGEDMTAFVDNIDRIRAATSAHVLVVHHCGKNKALGARGHSSLRAATDVELEVADKVMTNTKQRDKPLAPPVPFDLVQVPIGVDAKLRSVTSCVVIGRTAEGRQMPAQGTPPAHALAALDFLADFTGDELSAVPVDEWRKLYQRRHCEGMGRGAKSMAFKRARDTLVNDGHVVIENENARVAIF